MLRRLLILLLLMTAPALSQVQQIQIQFLDEFMREVNLTTSASIYIYNIGTTTESNIYLDRNRQVAITQPITDTSTNTPLDYTRGILTFYKRQPGFKIVVTDGNYTRIIDTIIQQSNVIWWPTFMTASTDITRINAVEGSGTPEGTTTSSVGGMYLRTDGGSGSTVYTKVSGTAATGWRSLGIKSADESANATLTALGESHVRGDQDRISTHMGSGGEIAGEATMSMLSMLQATFDPGAWYDSDNAVFLMEVHRDLYPNGIIIDEWKVSFNRTDPSAELNADLRYANDWATLAEEADIDILDTSSGVSSEDTDSAINSGTAIPADKVIYIGFDGDPEGTGTQLTFTMIFHAEED